MIFKFYRLFPVVQTKSATDNWVQFLEKLRVAVGISKSMSILKINLILKGDVAESCYWFWPVELSISGVMTLGTWSFDFGTIICPLFFFLVPLEFQPCRLQTFNRLFYLGLLLDWHKHILGIKRCLLFEPWAHDAVVEEKATPCDEWQ